MRVVVWEKSVKRRAHHCITDQVGKRIHILYTPAHLLHCRGYFLSPKRGVNVPFHPGHHRAVQARSYMLRLSYSVGRNVEDVGTDNLAWLYFHNLSCFSRAYRLKVQAFIRRNFGTSPMTVFHWRSEHVDESMLVRDNKTMKLLSGPKRARACWWISNCYSHELIEPSPPCPFPSLCPLQVPCAKDLAQIVNKFNWPATPGGYKALLMSDMPAPNNWHIMVRFSPPSIVACAQDRHALWLY